MPDNSNVFLQILQRTIQADPELQTRLFKIYDTGKFISAVCELALQSGHKLQQEEVIQAMRGKRSAWLDQKQA